MSTLSSPPSRLLDDVRAILRDARAEYGSQLIRHLARALGEEFGKGMSVANLKNFRQFYLTFPDAGKRYAVRSELSWTHWRLVMRVEKP